MITVYTTDTCPRCKILKKKLTDKNIDYIELNDTNKLLDMGIDEVPIVQFEDNSLHKFSEAIEWVNNQ